MRLHEALAFARTMPAHPVTVAHLPDGCDYTWECPADCPERESCRMLERLRNHNWLTETDLAAGDYLAVPSLWGIDLTHPDGTPVPALVDGAAA